MRCRTGTLPNPLATVPRICVSGKTGHPIRRTDIPTKTVILVPPPVPLNDRPPSLTRRSRSARARQVFSEAPPPASEFPIADVNRRLHVLTGAESAILLIPTVLRKPVGAAHQALARLNASCGAVVG
jgi:hypothetical protein